MIILNIIPANKNRYINSIVSVSFFNYSALNSFIEFLALLALLALLARLQLFEDLLACCLLAELLALLFFIILPPLVLWSIIE